MSGFDICAGQVRSTRQSKRESESAGNIAEHKAVKTHLVPYVSYRDRPALSPSLCEVLTKQMPSFGLVGDTGL